MELTGWHIGDNPKRKIFVQGSILRRLSEMESSLERGEGLW